jgi:hypothetical protein
MKCSKGSTPPNTECGTVSALVSDFKNQSPHVKKNINKTHSALLDELDNLELLIKRYDFELEFPKLITTTTRIKIIKDLIILFSYFKNKDTLAIPSEDKSKLLNTLKICNKRIKLHLYQLKILVPTEVPSNIEYFGMIVKICLTILLKIN